MTFIPSIFELLNTPIYSFKCVINILSSVSIITIDCIHNISCSIDKEISYFLYVETTMILSCVGGTRVNPPCCKMSTFFLRSLALSVPIYRHFQSNGVNWRSIKHRNNISYIIGHYINFFVQHLILRQLAPFNWKFL